MRKIPKALAEPISIPFSEDPKRIQEEPHIKVMKVKWVAYIPAYILTSFIIGYWLQIG